MEISLDDLIVLEPRLKWGAEDCDVSGQAAKGYAVVSWVVSARSTAPHLPHLRGGEVVLIPPRVTAVIGGELPALMREAKLRDVAAVVFARGGAGVPKIYSTDDVTPLYWDGDLTADTETGINRLLTECRGNLYRVGSELERTMTDLGASRSGLRALVQTTSDLSGLPVRVIDAQGHLLVASHQDHFVSGGAFRATDETQVERVLPSGLSLILGPLRPEQRVVGRFLVDRIAAAVTIAARQDEAVRPRGVRRVEAVAALLSGHSRSPNEQRAAALALGLDPDATFLVAVSSGENDAAVTNALTPLGTIHEAGEVHGSQTLLIAASGRAGPDTISSRVAEAKRRWLVETKVSAATLAISGSASGVARLSTAAQEAGFIARLQTDPRFPHRAASFDSIEDIGAFQLLYPLRGTSELRMFVSEALGTLERRDQRGTLRETLRAYLETGGSRADASNQLGIHRNTLAYRLRRIGELIGRDVSDPKAWLTLHLALRALELLRVDSDEP
jgi:PucR C-terminal helix-turn-helix domain